MKKCPYCGKDNDDKASACERCFAGFPAEKQKEEPVQPKKAEKKLTRSEKYGT